MTEDTTDAPLQREEMIDKLLFLNDRLEEARACATAHALVLDHLIYRLIQDNVIDGPTLAGAITRTMQGAPMDHVDEETIDTWIKALRTSKGAQRTRPPSLRRPPRG